MDLREYGLGAQILTDLGIRRIRLLTNNPKKVVGLEGYGLEIVEQVPIKIRPNPYNARYLKTKREKLGPCSDMLTAVSAKKRKTTGARFAIVASQYNARYVDAMLQQ